MSADIWSPPPSFVAGQYFSAEMHGNALVRACDLLLGVYLAPEMAAQSGKAGASDWGYGFGNVGGGYKRVYSGWVRHRKVTLSVGVRTFAAQTVRVRAGDITSSTVIGSATDTTITVDITAIGTALEGFYEVFVDATGIAQPLWCYETDVQSYDALVAFSSGTPSAATWNSLSTRAGVLWAQTRGNAIPTPRYEVTSDDTIAEHETGRYVIRHKHRWLAWQVRVIGPGPYYPIITYDTTKLGGVGYAQLAQDITAAATTVYIDDMDYPDNQVIYPNGSTIMVVATGEVIKLGTRAENKFTGCTRGHANTTAAAANAGWGVRTWQQEEAVAREQTKGYVTWRGQYDLAGVPSLTVGSLYNVTVDNQASSDSGHFVVDYLYEVSSTSPALAGWTEMAAFARGDSVSAAKMAPISANLTWLSDSRIIYRNNAAPYIGTRGTIGKAAWGGYMVRQRRWLLYYYIEEDAQPEIRYFHGDNKTAQVVGLTGGKPYEALAYDLEAAEGLYPGVQYGVYGCTYAMEDDVQV